MDKLKVERVGGFAGFGGGHLRSDGEMDLTKMAPADRARIDHLFEGVAAAGHAIADGFRYRLTRPDGTTVEAPESAVPQAVRDSVQDRLE